MHIGCVWIFYVPTVMKQFMCWCGFPLLFPIERPDWIWNQPLSPLWSRPPRICYPKPQTPFHFHREGHGCHHTPQRPWMLVPPSLCFVVTPEPLWGAVTVSSPWGRQGSISTLEGLPAGAWVRGGSWLDTSSLKPDLSKWPLAHGALVPTLPNRTSTIKLLG